MGHPDWSLMSPDPGEELRRHTEFDHAADGTPVNDHGHDEGHAHLPPLDRECWQCQGAGVIPPQPGLTASVPRDTCGCCAGNGHILTDAGRQVIAFLQRHPAALTRVEG